MRPTWICRFRLRTVAHRYPSQRTPGSDQRSLPAAYYRGGTSRAVIIQPQDLPSNRKEWPGIFRQIIGSGDKYGRQLDGMGAGISSLSKICLVEPYSSDQTRGREDPHVDYTFVGLGIENNEVDVAGNCGNMSSAIGPYAYNCRLLPPDLYARKDGEITVRIRNTNTNKLIDSTFRVVGGEAAVVGDYSIDGVAGRASQIQLDFQWPYGSKTGRVLPTGKKVDNINGYKVSCVDGANPAVFVRADSVGIDGTILPNDLSKQQDKLDLLESIRKAAAVAMGVANHEDEVPRTIPKIGIVSQSTEHSVLSGDTLRASQTDIVVRFLSDTQPHRAIPLTAALTTAVAARIPGTIVEQLLAPESVMEKAITIGHASGRLQVNATMDSQNSIIPKSASVYRTAKRLFEGKTFWTGTSDKTEQPSGELPQRHSLGMAFVSERKTQDPVPEASPPEETSSVDTVQTSQDASLPMENAPINSEPEFHAEGSSNFSSSREKSDNIQPISPSQFLEELNHLRSSIAALVSAYPPPISATPFAAPKKPSVPTPGHISHHLVAAQHHLTTLVSSLSYAPPKSILGKQWHNWAEEYSNTQRWRTKSSIQEEKKEARKPLWERKRDRALWKLNSKGEPSFTQKARQKLMEKSDPKNLDFP